VLGEPRDYCCAGCQAVAEAICAGGLEEYYRLRTASAPTASLAAEPTEDRLFDREDFQESFVRRVGRLREASLVFDRVRCPACLWLIERHLRAQPGVTEAAAGYAGQSARVVWDPSRISLSEIRTAVREIGYEARPFDPSHRVGIERDASRRDAARLVFAGVLGMMVMNLALAAYFLGGPDASGSLPLWERFGRWCALFAGAVLLAYPGQDFFAGAWRDLRRRRVGMDTPIVLGLSAAWAASAWATVQGAGPVYFDAIAMLVFFVLLARAFETRARLSAAAALDRFAVVLPAMARRVDADGRESEIAALDLSPGDVVSVRPGDVVPADGVLLEGESSFDEAVLTGEPRPRARAPGDTAIAGSCNRDQPVLLRVTRAGEASTLGEIRRLFERGLASRPRYADLADRLAGRLVAAVLLLSAATTLFWAVRDPATALPATVAVLMVTCPCALALATPIALTVAAGRFARIGVLPARMASIERLASADTAVFDKTGTLTLSRPVLESVHTTGGFDSGTALAIASALEAASPHPIAGAFRAAIPVVTAVVEIPTHRAGEGVTGTVLGARWWLGSPAFAQGPGEALYGFEAQLAQSRADGQLAAVLADRMGRAALFTFAEELRPGAREIVADLRRAGIRRAVLLSGDARGPVERLGKALGFDEARGDMTASDKLEWIRSKEGSGSRLLFVGDGLNDAPTLAAAAASVSFAEAPQLSRLASDFVILGQGLAPLAAARRIARRSRRLLAQNIVWALAYNLLSVPLAALGLVPPWAAALGMSVSSLVVVANAMRLARREELIES
jgi:Cu2+-exporting ATPase